MSSNNYRENHLTTFKHFNQQEQEAWDSWSQFELVLSSRQKSEFGLHTKKEVREFMYQIGIQPGNFLFQYNKYDYVNMLVFRFENGTDLALLRMSLF